MSPTYHRVYRETDGGPIMADTSGGVIHVRFLSDAAQYNLQRLVNTQSDWANLVTTTTPWSLTLNGTDKPDWQYDKGEGVPSGTPQDADADADTDTDADGDADGESQGASSSDEDGLPGVPTPGESQGDGDDRPVMWGEFTPYAEKVDKSFGAVAATIASVSEETDKKLNKLQAAIAKAGRATQGSGGAIVKVEIHTPTEIKVGDGLFHHQFPLLTKLVAAGMHVYLPGPPGGGKSHAAEQIAGLLGWEFGSLSLGPTTPESRLWGGKDANGHFHEPGFITLARYAQDHPESGAAFCLDEMDNGHPGILATLNSAMANGWFTSPRGDTIRIGGNFSIIGAANTYGTGPTAEFSGRNRLDAATLDRFMYVPWDTDEKMEATLVRAFLAETENGSAMSGEWLDVWKTCRKNVSVNNLRVFVTMRGAINGAKLLSQGLDVDTVLGVVLLNKLPADQRAKIDPL